MQDWGKGGEKEGDIEGEFGMERGKERGEKAGRVWDNENVVLEGNQGRGRVEEREEGGDKGSERGEWVEVLTRKGKGRGKGIPGRKGSL